jgi:hypothetical protein
LFWLFGKSVNIGLLRRFSITLVLFVVASAVKTLFLKRSFLVGIRIVRKTVVSLVITSSSCTQRIKFPLLKSNLFICRSFVFDSFPELVIILIFLWALRITHMFIQLHFIFVNHIFQFQLNNLQHASFIFVQCVGLNRWDFVDKT